MPAPLSKLGAIDGEAIVRGRFEVAADGALVTSALSGVRAVALVCDFVNVEAVRQYIDERTGRYGLAPEPYRLMEHPLGSSSRRTPFRLIGADGASCLVPHHVSLGALRLVVPATPMPVRNLDPAEDPSITAVMERSRGLPGDLAYREGFLAPSMHVDVEMTVASTLTSDAVGGYRSMTARSYEVVRVARMEEVPDELPGLGLSGRIATWVQGLFRRP